MATCDTCTQACSTGICRTDPDTGRSSMEGSCAKVEPCLRSRWCLSMLVPRPLCAWQRYAQRSLQQLSFRCSCARDAVHDVCLCSSLRSTLWKSCAAYYHCLSPSPSWPTDVTCCILCFVCECNCLRSLRNACLQSGLCIACACR